MINDISEERVTDLKELSRELGITILTKFDNMTQIEVMAVLVSTIVDVLKTIAFVTKQDEKFVTDFFKESLDSWEEEE